MQRSDSVEVRVQGARPEAERGKEKVAQSKQDVMVTRTVAVAVVRCGHLPLKSISDFTLHFPLMATVLALAFITQPLNYCKALSLVLTGPSLHLSHSFTTTPSQESMRVSYHPPRPGSSS